ncbi:transketolase family protein [Mycobacterium kyorinense]|uniref:transketolase family protein n=1 Tax=Mycobacterium kyorinense TaxID=487514 RepID=UPI000A792FB4
MTAVVAGPDIDALSVNTIRTLCIDAVQAANSGHPGTPMAMAPVVYALWQKVLRFDPADPIWPNRDRFILSAGHASTLLYSILHLTNVQAVDADYETVGKPSVELDDLKKFRQLDSKCPGHPEYRWTSGIECTTGPLGTGVATSVGMAIASRWLAATYNRPGHELFGFNVYALAGDGDMMEGVASEAASLAAHLQLSNLCWVYDNNKITIEGSTDIAFTEDVATRFVGYGWNVTRVGDANDLQMLARAFETFAHEQHRPTLIIVDSHIAYGAPTKEGTAAAHGEPLGEDEVRAAKSFYGFPPDEQFYIPEGVYENFADGIGARGARLSGEWKTAFEAYRAEFPDLADQLERMQRRELPDGWDADIPTFPADPKGIASRASSGQVLNALAKNYPWLIGGAADLAPSTKTLLTFDGAGDLEPGNPGGRNLHFGVREFASGAVTNGLALSKIRAYWSGFLIFSDFARGAIRLSAIMEIPTINIFTHDSIGVGEDGPTHQPVEQLLSLRAIPGLLVIRPSDAGPLGVCAGIRSCPGRLCARIGRPSGADPDGDRQRGVAGGGCLRAADRGGGAGPGGEHALPGGVRESAAVLPRRGAAAVGAGARRGRTGVDARLASLRRARRRRDRHGDVRGVRPVEGTAHQVRFHPGPGGRDGEDRAGTRQQLSVYHPL